jgi:hypothetical protein
MTRKYPDCPDCGAESFLLKQEIESNEIGLLLVDYLLCTNPHCHNHTPPNTEHTTAGPAGGGRYACLVPGCDYVETHDD